MIIMISSFVCLGGGAGGGADDCVVGLIRMDSEYFWLFRMDSEYFGLFRMGSEYFWLFRMDSEYFVKLCLFIVFKCKCWIFRVTYCF